MKVGVFSDTHGSLRRLDEALSRLGQMQAFIHLGDGSADAEAIADRTGLPFYAVRGNCDFSGKYPAERVVELDGARLLLVHGDKYYDLYALVRRAEALFCDAALFGHTHTPLLQACGKLLLINPGSLSRPRFAAKASCALLTIDGGALFADMISLS